MISVITSACHGPVVMALSVISWSYGLRGKAGSATPKLNLRNLVPWFIPGFLILAALRSFAIVAGSWAGPISQAAALLMVLSMAALGPA